MWIFFSSVSSAGFCPIYWKKKSRFRFDWCQKGYPRKIRVAVVMGGGGLWPPGVLPYKGDGGARRKISRTPLNGTRILFYGLAPISFPPLRATNSTITKYITGTEILKVIKITFEHFFSRTFLKVLSIVFILITSSSSSHFRFWHPKRYQSKNLNP